MFIHLPKFGKIDYKASCWKRVNQVDASNTGGSSSSSTAQASTGQAGQTAVRTTVQMGEIETGESFGEIIEETEEEFVDCIEPVVLVPDGITVVAMDLQDDAGEQMVQMGTGEEGEEECLVTLDSGADVSVLPRSFAETKAHIQIDGKYNGKLALYGEAGTLAP